MSFDDNSHAELFPPGLIHTMFEAFAQLLRRFACEPATSLGAARPSLVPPAQLATRAANKQQEHKPDLIEAAELMHLPIERCALAAPHRTAVVDGASGDTFDFEALLALARAYAARVVAARS